MTSRNWFASMSLMVGANDTQLLKTFFSRSDEFLQAQYSAALGTQAATDVETARIHLTQVALTSKFVDSALESARQKWCSILEGLQPFAGLEKLQSLTPSSANLESGLEAARKQIDSSKFLPTLREHSKTPFDDAGLGLEISPERWLAENDVQLPGCILPVHFKGALFEVTGHSSDSSEYSFKPSKSGGFFMMSLHLVPRHCIGHGAIDSLFGLSTLAHEIGHSTTRREGSLVNSFLNVTEEEDLDHEHDSYLYERVFMDHADDLLASFWNVDKAGFSERLQKRKAIQNNLHILKNRMNECYFSGRPLRQIQECFEQDMAKICPPASDGSKLEWVKYSTLTQPLSRVPYIRAYNTIFKSR